MVSFYAVVLLPVTYYIWPSIREINLSFRIQIFLAQKNVSQKKTGCQCEGDLIKRARNDAIKPWETRKRVLKATVLIFLWALFVFLAYKISTIEITYEEYDPYKILGLDQACSSQFYQSLFTPFRVPMLPKSRKSIESFQRRCIRTVEETLWFLIALQKRIKP